MYNTDDKRYGTKYKPIVFPGEIGLTHNYKGENVADDTTAFAITDGTNIGGCRRVMNKSELLGFPDDLLRNEGVEIWVVTEKTKYRLINWDQRRSLSGWADVTKGGKIENLTIHVDDNPAHDVVYNGSTAKEVSLEVPPTDEMESLTIHVDDNPGNDVVYDGSAAKEVSLPRVKVHTGSAPPTQDMKEGDIFVKTE
jgi:hypothetical protein